MGLHIEALRDEHLDEAAGLLAARHSADRRREVALPARFEEVEVAREALLEALGKPEAHGVVAVRDSRVIGYLMGWALAPAPISIAARVYMPDAVYVPYVGHAVSGVSHGEGGEIYRRMYAGIAADWVAAGLFSHYIWLPAGDQEAIDAWFSLDFGRETVHAIRETRGVEGGSPGKADEGISIRRAGLEDLEAVVELTFANWQYHIESPIFLPNVREAEQTLRDEPARLLADPEGATWLAYKDGRAVGLVLMKPSQPGMLTPDSCVMLDHGYTDPEARGQGLASTLLEEAWAWAREKRIEYCELKFFSANILGSRFWLGSGFRPLSYCLFRRVNKLAVW